MALHILLFFSISFLEHVSVTYEQLFISQQAAKLLAMINLVGLVLLSGCGWIYHSYNINPIILLCMIMTIKILLLDAIRFFAEIYWGIPSYNFYAMYKKLL
jgi:fumarate reductase subunit C